MKLKIDGLDCPNCARNLENQFNKLKSVKNAKIDFLKGVIEFDADNQELATNEITATAKSIYPDVVVYQTAKKSRNTNFVLNLVLLLAGLIIGIVALTVKMPNWLFWTMFSISALLMGYKVYYKAFALLRKGVINENLLVTISVVGATAVGEHCDGLMVIALYGIGKILENLALSKSKRSIEELTNIKPEYANVLTESGEQKLSPSLVKIGDLIIVRPGEKVAVDGEIVEGNSSVNVQSLTGESIPKQMKTGDKILSGSILLDGVLKIKATNLYSDSTVCKIMDLVENAQEKKSKTETFISKLSRWYTLGVIVLAFVVWGIVWLATKNFDTAVYRGLIFLVVSCPCAFAISVPLSYFSGIGNASSKGILIKGSNYLDVLAKVNVVAFDKTGTLTTGEFEITKIESFKSEYSEQDILYLTCLGEQNSNHPLAKSILKKCNKNFEKVENIKEISGSGVSFDYKNKNYFVGRKNNNHESTVVELIENDIVVGKIWLADSVKPGSKHTCKALKAQNIKTVMLSGDNKKIVEKVAGEIGIDKAYSNLLPQEKFEYLKNMKQDEKVCLAYVGDGLNDAPALSLADVGISMGLGGSSASVEASDMVLATDNPEKIIEAIKISKFTKKIVTENIVLSAVIKILFLTLGAFGITGMMSAVIADVGVTLVAILNSLRVLKFHNKNHNHKHNDHCHCGEHHHHEKCKNDCDDLCDDHDCEE